VQGLYPHLVLGQFLQGVDDGLEGTLHVCLDDEIERGKLPLASLDEQIRQGHAGA
jgi:hypothetical protein